jgi:hypothetical protein
MQQISKKFEFALQGEHKRAVQKRVGMKDNRPLNAVNYHGARLPVRMRGLQRGRNRQRDRVPKDQNRSRARRDGGLRIAAIVFRLNFPRFKFHQGQIVPQKAFQAGETCDQWAQQMINGAAKLLFVHPKITEGVRSRVSGKAGDR